MRKPILFLMLFTCLVVNAQEEKALQSEQSKAGILYPKINFSYDIEGNQTGRVFVWSSSAKTASPAVAETVVGKESDLPKLPSEDVVSYYPNPVYDELHLEWELVKNNSVEFINVYQLNGQLLQSFMGLAKTNSKTILFSNYPNGTYIVVLGYSNGKQKSIKINKK